MISRRTALQLLAAAPAKRYRVTLGEPKTLLAAGSLGLNYFPDMPVVALETKPRMGLLVTAGISTYLVEGADIEHLEQAAKVLSPGPPGSFDNGYAGVGGVYRDPGGALYGFYHAEDQEGMPAIHGGVPGFYASIGEAVSNDGGHTWRKLGAALTSAKPKQWTAYPRQADRGVGEPCVVPDREGKSLYLYYSDHSRAGGRGVQIAMARAALPPEPARWRKLHDDDAPVISARHLDRADALMPFVVWSAELRTYVMTLNVNCWREYSADSPRVSGIYVCYSEDGIVWSSLEQLVLDWAVARSGHSVSWHPTILWDEGSTHAGWLVYSRSERWGHRSGGGVPHYMVGRRIRID